VSCDGRSLGGAAGCGLRGSSFGSDLWCHVRLGGSRRLLGFGFLDSALASLRVSRHSPPLVHRGWLDAPRLLSCTGLFLFCVGLLAMSRSGPNLHSRIRFNAARGADKGGDFSSNLATALCHCLLPVAHQRPRCSTKTSRRRPYGRTTAPSSFVPNTCKQESGSTQLGVPTRGRFHLKPCHCLLSLSPTRRPPKTPLLHQNESSSDVRQRYGSVFVRA